MDWNMKIVEKLCKKGCLRMMSAEFHQGSYLLDEKIWFQLILDNIIVKVKLGKREIINA
jgi:hypothetical protein